MRTRTNLTHLAFAVFVFLFFVACSKDNTKNVVQDIPLESTAWSGKVVSKTAANIDIELPIGITFVDKTKAKMEYHTDPTSFIREVGYASFIWDTLSRTKQMQYIKSEKSIRFEGDNIHFMQDTWIIKEMDAQYLTLVARTENMQCAIWIYLTRRV